MHFFIVRSVAVLALTGLPRGLCADGPLPAKGDNGDMGGIFGIGKSTLSAGVSGMPPGLLQGLFTPGLETPKGSAVGATTVGSGPYPAQYVADPTLPNHTVYAPKSPPANVKMPVVVFGNGGCVNIGTLMSSLLTEIASHGYLVIANGPPQKGISMSMAAGALPQLGGKGLQGLLSGLSSLTSMAQSKVSQMTESIDWVYKGGAKKYGEIDIGKIAASGQSCGALEAYSASYHEPRVKLTVIFNVGVFDESRRYLISELKAPIGWFVGGPHDAGFSFAQKDYEKLSKGVPALFASLDTGHLGTYAAPNAGKFGKAAVSFLEWQFRGKADSKRRFVDPLSEGSFVKDNWNVTMKNI